MKPINLSFPKQDDRNPSKFGITLLTFNCDGTLLAFKDGKIIRDYIKAILNDMCRFHSAISIYLQFDQCQGYQCFGVDFTCATIGMASNGSRSLVDINLSQYVIFLLLDVGGGQCN